jgi:acyl carrier protein
MAREQSTEDAVKAVMADILGVEPASINGDTARDNTLGWDSANHITLTLALEEEFHIAFDVNEIENMFTFTDIVQVIDSKL